MDFSNITEGYAENEEGLVFRYNRKERLAHAPQIVKDYYDGKIVAFKPGLFKALVATRGNRFMLFALVICFLIVVFYGFFGAKENEDSKFGVHFSLSAFTYEQLGENIYVNLKIDPPTKKFVEDYDGEIPVKIEFFTVNAEGEISGKNTVLAKYNGKKLFLEKQEEIQKIKELKKNGKSVKVPNFGLDVKTSFSSLEVISVKADVELRGKKFSLNAPVKNVTDYLR